MGGAKKKVPGLKNPGGYAANGYYISHATSRHIHPYPCVATWTGLIIGRSDTMRTILIDGILLGSSSSLCREGARLAVAARGY